MFLIIFLIFIITTHKSPWLFIYLFLIEIIHWAIENHLGYLINFILFIIFIKCTWRLLISFHFFPFCFNTLPLFFFFLSSFTFPLFSFSFLRYYIDKYIYIVRSNAFPFPHFNVRVGLLTYINYLIINYLFDYSSQLFFLCLVHS